MNQATFRPISDAPPHGSSVVYVYETWDGGSLQLEVVDVEYSWHNDDGEHINYQNGGVAPDGFELIIMFGDHSFSGVAPPDGMWCYASELEDCFRSLKTATRHPDKHPQ